MRIVSIAPQPGARDTRKAGHSRRSLFAVETATHRALRNRPLGPRGCGIRLRNVDERDVGLVVRRAGRPGRRRLPAGRPSGHRIEIAGPRQQQFAAAVWRQGSPHLTAQSPDRRRIQHHRIVGEPRVGRRQVVPERFDAGADRREISCQGSCRISGVVVLKKASQPLQGADQVDRDRLRPSSGSRLRAPHAATGDGSNRTNLDRRASWGTSSAPRFAGCSPLIVSIISAQPRRYFGSPLSINAFTKPTRPQWTVLRLSNRVVPGTRP